MGLARLEQNRGALWEQLWACGEARRVASATLRLNTGRSEIVAHSLQALEHLEQWLLSTVEGLGFSSEIALRITGFLPLLEPTEFTPLEGGSDDE